MIGNGPYICPVGKEDLYDSPKFKALATILQDCLKKKEKVAVFSHRLDTLEAIQDLLIHPQFKWKYQRDYFRIDGWTSTMSRSKQIANFSSSADAKLILISTKAGGIGMNLVSATRVVCFDVHWNPCHDRQAIYRCYRYGQNKPVFIYIFVGGGMPEDKIFNRQIAKQSMFKRVVDQGTAQRIITKDQISQVKVYDDKPPNINQMKTVLNTNSDSVLREVLTQHMGLLRDVYEHVLNDDESENLTENEKTQTMEEWKQKKTKR